MRWHAWLRTTNAYELSLGGFTFAMSVMSSMYSLIPNLYRVTAENLITLILF